MPLYEYNCRDCGDDFEKIVSFSQADQLPECPVCGQSNTQKKISAGAFIGATSGSGSSTSAPASPPRFT
jgi:putative FmdB family regulatory protein